MNAAKDGTEEKKKLELELYNFRIKLWNLEEEERKYQQKQEELYRERLADNIASGGLERLYEDMFTNIKEKFIRYWLERIGIDRAMMNLEESIVRLSAVKLDILKEGSHQKEMNRQVKEGAAAATNAGMKGTESASGLPFPANIAAIALVLASVFSAIRKSKITGQRVMAAAEGAIINKPTLLLAGEALSRSGTEIVMPEKNFNKYMERDIIPGIMAKVNIDNSGLREELRQVRSAIFAIGDQIPGETGKAVKRALRGKF
ncbi:MAG: hypothetical protein U5N56_00020 [Candidatus Marinimicrobia bacterium]|nr:hypothetical protein [Candidatus Neomarinimicrobiota bacterium]